MNEKNYNGWTNYETWVIKLWMDNEESSYKYWKERADYWKEEPSTSTVWTKEESSKFNLADELKEHHADLSPRSCDVYADLINAALSEVNWNEIAESLLKEE